MEDNRILKIYLILTHVYNCTQVNGMYPPYYDPYFEFFHGDPYYNGNFGRPHNGAGGKRYHHERAQDKYNKNDKVEKEKKKDIDDDFVSIRESLNVDM